MRAQLLKSNEESDREKKVLTKSIVNLTAQLGLSRQELSVILGISEATLSRIFTKESSYIDPHSKEGQLAILFLRLYRTLAAHFGGNVQHCELWLRSNNKHLEGIPIQLIQSVEGIVIVVQYLDAMRG